MVRHLYDEYPLKSAAVLESWAALNRSQRRDRTANARRGLHDKFDRQARELAAANGVEMSPQELAESAERLRRAHFKRLSVKSVASRRAKSLKSRIPAGGEET
jgi:hypothetical protein